MNNKSRKNSSVFGNFIMFHKIFHRYAAFVVPTVKQMETHARRRGFPVNVMVLNQKLFLLSFSRLMNLSISESVPSYVGF